MFLTIEDLQQLTGYKNKSKQCEWLNDHHIAFLKNRYERPLVPLAQIERLFGVSENNQVKTTQPNEEGFKKYLGLTDGAQKKTA